MSAKKIPQMLRQLLFEKNSKPKELARLTNVPQPTIQKIVVGTSTRPHISSLQPTADSFNISVTQLKGKQAIAWLNNTPTTTNRIAELPILQWDDIIDWLHNKNKVKFCKTIFIDINISKYGFALTIKDDAMQPVFAKGTTIILDPAKEPKNRNYAVIKINHQQEIIFRQLLIDGNNKFIKPLNPDNKKFRIQMLKSGDEILATFVQAKHNYNE